jgi:hypothetical protein
VATQIKLWKWKWIGHKLRKDSSTTEKQVLSWNPQGQHRRGRQETARGKQEGSSNISTSITVKHDTLLLNSSLKATCFSLIGYHQAIKYTI